MCEIDAIILASGTSSRMRQNKLLRLLDEEKNMSVLDSCLSAIPYQLFKNVMVLVSDRGVKKNAENYPVQIIYNESYKKGKSQAIIKGTQQSKSLDGIMFFVADQPLLMKRTITKLVQQFTIEPKSIVVPVVEGKPRNPVCFPVQLKSYFYELQADQGGKEIIARFPEKVIAVSFDDSQEFCDVDTNEAFHKVKAIYDRYK